MPEVTLNSPLCDALKRTAWGYLLLHININLGALNILPDWAGYLLILSALPALAGEVRSALLLRNLGRLLALWAAADWVLVFLGTGAADVPLLGSLELVITAVGLYFHFQLLTNLAELAGKYGCPQEGRILRLRTVRTVLVTALALLPMERIAQGTWSTAAVFVILLVQLFVALMLCSALFSLRRSVMELQL